MAEAAALKMGMMMASEAQWKEVEFQSDCRAIVDMIMEEKGARADSRNTLLGGYRWGEPRIVTIHGSQPNAVQDTCH